MRALTPSELDAIASGCAPAALAARAEDGALPPPFVAARAVALAAAGHPLPWATVFLIVDDDPGARIVGSCGFKSAPADGRVDLGYGVAPAARRRGAATAAVDRLVTLAFEAGARELLAEVAPANHVSAKVVRHAGFASIGGHRDTGGEFVDRWLRIADRPPPTDRTDPCTTRS